MIQFKYRKRETNNQEPGNLVVYYNFFDMFIGTLLLVLVVFFMNHYISNELKAGFSSLPEAEYVDPGTKVQ